MDRLMLAPPRLVSGWKRFHRAAVVAVAVLCFGGGCAHQRPYLPTELPAEFVAPPTPNIQEIDLSRLSNVPVNSQLIARGDVLEVTVGTDSPEVPPLSSPVRVGPDGVADVPFVRHVKLAGLELEDAEQLIKRVGIERGQFTRPPRVTVKMDQRRTNNVMVVGAVNDPGIKELPSGASTLFNALVAAGSLSEDAGQEVEIRRNVVSDPAAPPIPPSQRVALGAGAERASYEAAPPAPLPALPVIRVNLATAALEGGGGHYLNDGDTVVVHKRAPRPISVLGLVRDPAQYELPPSEDMYLLQALAKAGGRTMGIADKVLIIRRLPGQDRTVNILTSVREAKRNNAYNVRLASGDIVIVEETPATVVLDALKSFIRFGMSSTIPLF